MRLRSSRDCAAATRPRSRTKVAGISAASSIRIDVSPSIIRTSTPTTSISTGSSFAQCLLILLILCFLPSVFCRPFVLIANKRDLRLAEIGHRPLRTSVVVRGVEEAASLDYVVSLNLVCWSEIRSGRILCARIEPRKRGRNIDKFVVAEQGVLKPEGLACDWSNRLVFWTDSDTKRIEVASISDLNQNQTRYRKVLVWQDLDLPRSIVVAPQEGLIFWTDWGLLPRVERANMDGGNRLALVNSEIQWPNGLTLDFEQRRLFWVDAKLRHIASVDWDGRNKRIILRDTEALQQPFAISYHQQQLLWTDWTTTALMMVNMSSDLNTITSSPEALRFRGNRVEPIDVKVFEPTRQPEITDKACLNHKCSHMCLPSKNGPSCACPTGIRLIDDYNCADGFRRVLLLAKTQDVRKISLDTPDFTDIVIDVDHNNKTIAKLDDEVDYEYEIDYDDDKNDEFVETRSSIAIDFDPQESLVYWTDRHTGIHRSTLNGKNEQVVVSEEVRHPDGLAVDWLSRNLFWTDTGSNRIEVARLDNATYMRLTLISSNLDEPRAIAVHPIQGWLFWSDWGQGARIERAWMDGSHREVIIDSDIEWPNGLVLDLSEDRIYWCDAKLDRIEMASLDGSGRRTIIDDTLPHPFGLTLLDNHLYWTDWQENVVERADKVSGEERTILVAHLTDLMGLHATYTNKDDTESPLRGLMNKCMLDNGGCQHLCLVTPDSSRLCACSNDFELQEDGFTCQRPEAVLLYGREDSIGRLSLRPEVNLDIRLGVSESVLDVAAIDFDSNDQNRLYWSDVESKSISRGYSNGSNVQTLISYGLDFPYGLAVDWSCGNVFWSDMGLDRIEVASLHSDNTLFRRAIVWQNVTDPASLALDPSKGLLFWSSWGVLPLIEYSKMDGSGRKVFISSRIGRTNGLTLDSDKLYWTDMDQMNIAMASIADTRQKIDIKVIVNKVSQPYGLTMFGQKLYWAEWQTGSVERADKNDGNNRQVVQENVGALMDLLVVHKSRQESSSPCQTDNGKCSHLCLPLGNNEVKCACPSHYEGELCTPPKVFMVIGQRSKFARLIDNKIDNDDNKNDPAEVPTVALPIHGARHIGALDYDPIRDELYWLDLGHHDRRGRRHSRVTLMRGQVDDTMIEHWLQPDHIKSDDDDDVGLAIDYNSRIVYWTVGKSINMSRIDDNGASEHIGAIKIGDEDNNKEDEAKSPGVLLVHHERSLLFWSVRSKRSVGGGIEVARLDGRHRQHLVQSFVQHVTAMSCDPKNLFWSDLELKRIEKIDLDAKERAVILSEATRALLQPVALVAHEEFLYWADAGHNHVGRVHKTSGKWRILVGGMHHLSVLVSVKPSLRSAECASCSHHCLLGENECACPLGSGLVLSSDGFNCGFPPTCKPDEFTCKSGSPACIPLQWRCDGQPECVDISDEIDCPECGQPNMFRCRSGQCVNASRVCDGRKDCDDNTDEISCCPANHFRCVVSGECIDNGRTCDNNSDCDDNSDELLPQCNEINNADHMRAANTADNNNSDDNGDTDLSLGIVFIALIMAFVVGALGVGVAYANRKWIRREDQRVTTLSSAAAMTSALGTEPAMGSAGVVNMSTGFEYKEESHVFVYDRNHVTGASSSATDSIASQALRRERIHPPSPSTTIRRQMEHGHHRRRRGHNTASSSEYFRPSYASPGEESDVGFGEHNKHFTSVANSVVGYDSEIGCNNIIDDFDHEQDTLFNDQALAPPPSPDLTRDS